MNDDTVLQFGRVPREAPDAANVASVPRATVCPLCHSRFSVDGRFCPFDGAPLVAAVGWDPAADALLGSVVDGRYEVEAVLGEGGMGTVYRVTHRALGKRFALKALRKDLASDGEIAARFIQEARTAAAVSHPGLVEITDFGRLASGQVYFVMELLEGQSLAALLRLGGPLPAARGLDIVRQLANALKAAHDSAIVHRDLKPDNIHVGTADGGRDRMKIVDFGLAKVIGSSRLTRAGMVFGTPHYMSPEQAAGDVVDHRADIYALGIVMYEMFTGKVPFEADSYMGVLTKHMYMAPAPPSDLRPQLKELGALEDVILRCLQKRPAGRYEHLAALLADLDRLGLSAEGSGAQAAKLRRRPASLLADQLELPSRDEVEPRPRSRLARPLLIVMLAFLLGGGLVLALRWPWASKNAARREIVSLPAVTTTPASVTTLAERPPPAFEPGSAATTPSAPVSRASTSAGAPQGARRRLGQPAASQPEAPGSQRRRLGSGEIVDPWAH